jgi:hypothetical protein
MLHKRGYKEPLDFRKAILPETIAARRRDNWDIFYDYTGCSLYYEQVKAYMQEFPHVKVVLYEDLEQNPGKTLREICEFLSVDFREDVKLERLNKSGVPKFELLNEIINKSSFLKDFLMAVIPMTVRKRMKHSAYKLNMKPAGMSREQKDYLYPFYAADIENLSGLLKRDLSVWLKPERADNSPL